MTRIEGIGDEVTDFFIALGILLVAWLAWCSTNITDQPLIRTVLILQRRTRIRIARLRAHNNQNTITNSQPRNLEVSEEESVESSNTENNDVDTSCPESSVVDASSSTLDRVSEATTSEEVIIEAMDSFNNDDTTLLQKPTQNDSIELTEKSEPTFPNTSECTNESSLNTDANEISIKLKFINDDQKIVTGSLKEMLGDFKRRHFQVELNSEKLVRLIFKGQVLQPDSQTLERCGLYNNCVVHCLIHQQRPNTAASSQPSTLEDSSFYFNPQAFQDLPPTNGISSVHNEWDLSRLLVSFLTLMLCLAWYSRYHYAQLFTATSTLALYALTAIFTVSLFSNFFPDQDSIRNIE